MILYSGVDVLFYLILQVLLPNSLKQELIVNPGEDYPVIQHLPKVGISIFKIKPDDIPGQYITIEVDCMQRNFLLMEKQRKCLDLYKVQNGKTTYIQLPKTYKELYIITIRSKSMTNGIPWAHRIYYELISNDDEVEKIRNSVFDLAL